MIVRKDELTPIDFEGLKIFDFTGNAGLSSSIAIISAPAGSVHATAWSRRSDKYYLVIGGSIQFTLGEKEIVLKAGDFCLVRQGQSFSYKNAGPIDAQLVLVHTPSFDLASEVFVNQH